MTTTTLAGPVADQDAARPLRTDSEVLERVDWLLDACSRRRRSVWLAFLTATGLQLPVVVPIDAVPEYADLPGARSLCWIAAETMRQFAPGGSAVLALTRPGPADAGPGDLEWEQVLSQAARERGVVLRMVCLATPEGVRPLSAAIRRRSRDEYTGADGHMPRSRSADE